MSSPSRRLSVGDHVGRAATHEQVALALQSAAGEEWAAVPYFYSAYHLVRAALSADPIFDDPTRLSAVHAQLTMADRDATRHHGYMKSEHGGRVKVWGINDLVAALYKPIWPFYAQLHEASNDVRYHAGLRVPLDKLVEAHDEIKAKFAAGELSAGS